MKLHFAMCNFVYVRKKAGCIGKVQPADFAEASQKITFLPF